MQKCDTYDRSILAEWIDKVVRLLEPRGSFYGKTVLLKPNLISSKGPRLACTHGEFVAGASVWFLEQGARVLVGDSPAFGNTTKVCEKQGISRALHGLDVKLIDFVSPVRVQLAGGTTVTLAREALECDFLVGLPKIKAHQQMFVTMAVKNMFGTVKGVKKALLHMVHGGSHDRFAEIILDLLPLLPPQLHLADGIEVMHGTGPLHGNPLTLNCLAASLCPVALDTAMLQVLQLTADSSPLWRVAAERGLVGSSLANLRFPLLAPEDFQGAGFFAPDILDAVRFNPGRLFGGMVKRVTMKIAG